MSTEYGIRLKLAMEKSGLDQKALVKKTGLRQSSVSSAINRASGSSDTTTYARACGVDAHWLATGEGEMAPVQTPSTAAPAAVASLEQITEALAGYFEGMDASTRKMAVVLLGQLADDPKDHSRIAAMIDLSIRSKNRKAA